MSKIILFDVMGNDNGVKAAIDSSLEFVNSNKDYKIHLIGDENEINKFYNGNNKNVLIIHSPNIAKKENENINVHKEDNSMNKALTLLKEGKGNAVLSSGDSGTYLMSSIMIVRRMQNVSRPAFMSIIPTIKEDKKFILLDEGANLNTTDEYLVQWAKLGAAFSRSVLKINKPDVAILNNGTEDNKGFEYHQQANKQLKSLNEENFIYKGFIESRYLLEGNVDVVVADGFSGNIALKSLEGTVLSFTKLLKAKLIKNLWRKICTLLLKSAFKEIKEHLDYRNVGAAWILGVNGIVIKAHGSSDKKAYLGALNQIKQAIDSNALEEFKKAIE